MLWLRMIAVAARLSRPYWFTPWRSPLLRWRMETYGITDADGRPLYAEEITPARFFQFIRQHHTALRQFLRWAAGL